ncbi:DNA cytosine methyltransferase [Paraburkholderia phenoliruptrix]|uniref:DNA cytosine methyltransferase n=1 Tax=Paraburkholderia phenoliruptrix TaxID=252970 RepID=UPI001C4F3CAB|nr:DNA cytosine methyltransferase [Paraburkholderia phenoliruptrix]MBW0450881.1 DNA cytosine methyltransferase [Paraburkholderia phenoliruptrix]MBW9100974.1 DNA cytosine methyltransferase [Paraburkholderia phenoliruptrix]
MSGSYYNEIDPYCAQWLRNLIAAGHIAPGDVDERSIEDVRPDDLRGYTQCHFFAGIGVWSSALRLAGWPDDRPVWTGSCPCQPFSQAGKGAGFADERHLWPAWHHLISECRPPVIFGEQVASKDVDPWIDLVFDDLEAMEYACAANPFPSAGVGAPHIRDRTFFVAYANDARSQRRHRVRERAAECIARARGVAGIVADADGGRRSPRSEGCATVGHGTAAESDCRVGRMADADGGNASAKREQRSGQHGQQPEDGRVSELGNADSASERRGCRAEGSAPCGSEAEACGQDRQRHEFVDDRAGATPPEPAGPTNGFWRAADWLLCRDGKWRPVEPGTFPLAHGAPARVGRLRAYGNAINREAAAAFIAAADEALKDK